MSTILIDRLCDLVSAGEMSRAGLARAAGLHPNSLRKLGDADWNPTADTLGKLEKFLASGSSGVMASAEQIIELMEELNATQHQTFVIVTHAREVAERTDRIIQMMDGAIVNQEQMERGRKGVVPVATAPVS